MTSPSKASILRRPEVVMALELVSFLALVGTAALLNPILSAVLFLFLLPLSLHFYGFIHNHFHSNNPSSNDFKYNSIGIAVSAPLGMSWFIYKGHHANHHKFNNAEGDYARTVDHAGRSRSGIEYLWRTAVLPSIIQFIPYISVVMMKREHRTVLCFVDETCRVFLRMAVLLIFCCQSLAVVLFSQTAFLSYLFYINYLQHLDCAPPRANDWQSPWFNELTHNLGFHDHHHNNPRCSPDSLQASPCPSKSSAIYAINPVAFVTFLFAPEHLVSRGTK